MNVSSKGPIALHVALMCTLMAACATTSSRERVVYQTVTAPTPVSCVPKDAPASPKVHTPEELLKVPAGPERYVMVAADYLKLYAWSLIGGPVVEGCRNAAAP